MRRITIDGDRFVIGWILWDAQKKEPISLLFRTKREAKEYIGKNKALQPIKIFIREFPKKPNEFTHFRLNNNGRIEVIMQKEANTDE